MRDATHAEMKQCFDKIDHATAHGDTQFFIEAMFKLHELFIAEKVYLNE